VRRAPRRVGFLFG
jgi:hypothetical protein